MTLKEAVLKSLEDINDITNYLAVLNHINEKKYYFILLIFYNYKFIFTKLQN